MPLDTLIKTIRDIMRKDAGVAGDAQRIEQLTWMLFLKILDDQEDYFEMLDTTYRSPLPENLRWRNWAKNPEGMTGDELVTFVNTELFPKLKELSVGENTRARIIRDVFEDANNYMKSGVHIRQVVNEINRIDFNRQQDRHVLNDIYEKLLKELQNAGDYGEFYTPRPLTQFIVEMVNPHVGDTVYDPACGTGGFLVSYLEHLRQTEVGTHEQEDTVQASLYGTELKPLPYILTITNLMIHGVDVPDTITRDNALAKPLTDYAAADNVDRIVANPPFGAAVQEGLETNFPQELRTRETTELFMVLFMHLLKDGGEAGIVVPDGFLFSEGVTTNIKQKLLEEHNLHTVVRLPSGVFNPYAGVNTNLIFFTKGEPTQNVWYYQVPLPDDLNNQYTKTRGIRHEEFQPVKDWWHNREETAHAWNVSIEAIRERNYNLDFKNPHASEAEEYRDPKEIVESIEAKEKEIAEVLGEVKKDLE